MGGLGRDPDRSDHTGARAFSRQAVLLVDLRLRWLSRDVRRSLAAPGAERKDINQTGMDGHGGVGVCCRSHAHHASQRCHRSGSDCRLGNLPLPYLRGRLARGNFTRNRISVYGRQSVVPVLVPIGQVDAVSVENIHTIWHEQISHRCQRQVHRL